MSQWVRYLILEFIKSERSRELEEAIRNFNTHCLSDKIKSLELALHDAIRRPMGVIPASAEPFVTTEGLKAAENRRKNIKIPKQNLRSR